MSGCDRRCWEGRPCPVCGSEFPPRGRSVPAVAACGRSDCPKDDPVVNPRHEWTEQEVRDLEKRLWNSLS